MELSISMPSTECGGRAPCKLIQLAPQGHGKLNQAQAPKLCLKQDTWALEIFYQDCLNSDSQDSEMETEAIWSRLGDATSMKVIVKQLFEKNVTIRQAQLVVDWLVQQAADVNHYNQVFN